MHRLGNPQPPRELAGFPKASQLDRLARAGLPVPEGVVVFDVHRPTLAEELADAIGFAGPWIFRMALAREDRQHASAAGLGLSCACKDREAFRPTLQRLRDHAGDEPWALLVQRAVPADELAVVLDAPQCPGYVESHHRPEGYAFDEGRTPDYAGPIHAWAHPDREGLASLLRSVVETTCFERGLDAEFVHDGASWWVVQARPLVHPLFEDWPRFVSLLDEPSREALAGRWVADFEHNPAPLSFAHRWLLEQIRRARPGAVGEPRDFNGWLYLRTPLRQVASAATLSLDDARSTLRQLLDVWIPELRARVDAHRAELDAGTQPLRAGLDSALQIFFTMADRYASTLMPARRSAAAAAGSSDRLASPPTTAATLFDKAAHLHVLPLEWDIASPSLERGLGADEREPAQVLDTKALPAQAVALYLGELDDHFFAWGLRPLRTFYREAAKRLDFAAEDLFELSGDEVLEFAADPSHASEWTALAQARRLLRGREATLEAPAVIVDGRPYPDGGQRDAAAGDGLWGYGIGEAVEATLTHRRSLAELVERPPREDQVVALPALTAPAAYVLKRLGVRSICTFHGGAASHGSLMARELGLSAIIGCRGLEHLPEGTRVHLDTRRGRIRIIDR